MKQNKLLIAAGTLLFGMQLQAAPLTPQQALGRVTGDSSSRAAAPSLYNKSLKLVHTGLMPECGVPAYFVFQAEGGKGFVIVSADDNAEALLARVDDEFDLAQIPDAMKYWLDEYARQVEFASNHELSEEAVAIAAKKIVPFSKRVEITPLVKAKWGQNYPFNTFCPGYNTATGCVATAMAQVMSYHKWPAKGQGCHSYTYEGQTYSLDFSNLEFKWDIMPDVYDYTETGQEEGLDQIARLMQACGYSVNMHYGKESGTATQYVGTALTEYFGYSEAALMRHDTYCDMEWSDMIYNELANGRPLVYDGTNLENTAAHCFVCDGYSTDGTFHFNWGWNGRYDGYFRLSALIPTGVGTGGGSGNYSNAQKALIGLARPDATDLPKLWPLYVVGGLGSRNSSALKDGSVVSFNFGSGYVLNNSNTVLDGMLGIEVVKDGESLMVWPGWEVNFKGLSDTWSMSGFSEFEANATISTLEPGSYCLFPAFRRSNTDWWFRIPVQQGDRQYMILNVKDTGKGYLSSTGIATYIPDFEVSGMEVMNKLASQENGEFRISYRNGEKRFSGDIFLKAQLDGGDRVIGGASVEAGINATGDMDITIPMDIREGEYTVYFVDAYANVISETFTIDVDEPIGVAAIGSEEGEAEYFDLLGRRVNAPSKGIVIRRAADGSVKKQVR